MRKILIYNSLIAESLISAAIQMQSTPGVELFDAGENFIPPFDQFPKDKEVQIFLMCDLSKETEKCGKHVDLVKVEALSKKSKEYRRRLLLVWERENPGVVRPRAVHLLGGFQVSEGDAENSEALSYAVVSYLGDLNDGATVYGWQRLLGGDGAYLSDLIEKGRAIQKYASKFHIETAVNIDIEEILETNESMADEIVKLQNKLSEASNLKPGTGEATLSMEQVFKICTPKQIAGLFRVSDLKGFAKANGLKGYSKMKEVDLIPFIKKALK